MLQFAKTSLAISLAVLSFSSCKNDPKNQAGNQPPKLDTIQVRPVSKVGAVQFAVTEGIITWTGKKALGDGHRGTISVKQGNLMVNENQLISGDLSIDMNSIAVTDVEDAGERRDLESHLKDADFFETDQYPEAIFLINQVLPSNAPEYNWLIVGMLTMKGKTNPVNIPVKMTIEGDKLKATSPTFPINRTQWGVNFRSGILGTAKDKLIDDVILLSLTLQAHKS